MAQGISYIPNILLCTSIVEYYTSFFLMRACSVVSNSVTFWTVAHQAPLSRGFSSKNIEVVAMPSSRESSRPRDQTRVSYVSCIGRQILKHLPRMTGKTRTRRGWIRTKKLENQSWQRLQALSEEEWLAGGGRQQPCVQRAACTERQMGAEPGKPAPVPPGACRPHVM